MDDGVLDERLDKHGRHAHYVLLHLVGHVDAVAELVAEARTLQVEVEAERLQLIAQRHHLNH